MPSESDGPAQGRVSADEAFATLGNDTRSTIVQTLSEADGPVSFGELQSRVGLSDSGQFNYHLEQLVGHFVRKTDAGYALRQAGDRIVEAVSAGIVTDQPVVEITPVDETCYYCGGDVVVRYRQEQVDMFCTDCSGAYGESHATGEIVVPEGYGWLGGLPLPPAGTQDRTASEILAAAVTLGQTEFVATNEGVCPRCSAAVDRSVSVCADHDAADELCPACDRRRGVVVGVQCTNCNYTTGGGLLTSSTP